MHETGLAGRTLLEPSMLTIGFARRFAAYKSADLIIYDVPQLTRLLMIAETPYRLSLPARPIPPMTRQSGSSKG
jgi:starch phosphorylase